MKIISVTVMPMMIFCVDPCIRICTRKKNAFNAISVAVPYIENIRLWWMSCCDSEVCAKKSVFLCILLMNYTYFILSCPVQHICVVTKRGREPRSVFLSLEPYHSVAEQHRISSYACRKQLLSTQTKPWGKQLRKLSCVLKACVKMREIQFSRLSKVPMYSCLYQR